MTTRTDRTTSRSPAQWLSLVIGVVYLLVGLPGFFVTGFDGFAEHEEGQTLLGFAVNPLHNVVHLVVGALGIALSSTVARARLFGWVLLLGYGLTAVYGLVAVGNDDLNVLNINGADNGLHIVSALAGLVIVLLARRDDHRV